MDSESSDEDSLDFVDAEEPTVNNDSDDESYLDVLPDNETLHCELDSNSMNTLIEDTHSELCVEDNDSNLAEIDAFVSVVSGVSLENYDSDKPQGTFPKNEDDADTGSKVSDIPQAFDELQGTLPGNEDGFDSDPDEHVSDYVNEQLERISENIDNVGTNKIAHNQDPHKPQGTIPRYENNADTCSDVSDIPQAFDEVQGTLPGNEDGFDSDPDEPVYDYVNELLERISGNIDKVGTNKIAHNQDADKPQGTFPKNEDDADTGSEISDIPQAFELRRILPGNEDNFDSDPKVHVSDYVELLGRISGNMDNIGTDKIAHNQDPDKPQGTFPRNKDNADTCSDVSDIPLAFDEVQGTLPGNEDGFDSDPDEHVSDYVDGLLGVIAENMDNVGTDKIAHNYKFQDPDKLQITFPEKEDNADTISEAFDIPQGFYQLQGLLPENDDKNDTDNNVPHVSDERLGTDPGNNVGFDSDSEVHVSNNNYVPQVSNDLTGTIPGDINSVRTDKISHNDTYKDSDKQRGTFPQNDVDRDASVKYAPNVTLQGALSENENEICNDNYTQSDTDELFKTFKKAYDDIDASNDEVLGTLLGTVDDDASDIEKCAGDSPKSDNNSNENLEDNDESDLSEASSEIQSESILIKTVSAKEHAPKPGLHFWSKILESSKETFVSSADEDVKDVSDRPIHVDDVHNTEPSIEDPLFYTPLMIGHPLCYQERVIPMPYPLQVVMNSPADEVLKDEDNFIQNISQFYNQEAISDVLLKIGDLKYYGHKFVLAKSSDVFRTMLYERPWSQGNTEEVELNESPECVAVFDKFLRYLYTAEVMISTEAAVGILCLADKYNVGSLKELCVKYMVNNAKSPLINNALTWYPWSKALHLDELHDQCTSTIGWNCNDLIASPDWLNMDVEFICDVLRSAEMVVTDEYSLFEAVTAWLMHPNHLPQMQDYAQRLLKLIRFPQMMVSQLYQIEYSDIASSLECGELISQLIGRAYRYRAICPYQAELSVSFDEPFYIPRDYIHLSVDSVKIANSLRFQVDVKMYIGPVPDENRTGDWRITYRRSNESWTVQIYCHESAMIHGRAKYQATLLVFNDEEKIIQVERAPVFATCRGTHQNFQILLKDPEDAKSMCLLIKPLPD